VSAIPYAVAAPLLVVMAQSAWVVITGWNFRHNAMFAHISQPMTLAGLATIAVVSFYVIRPFVNEVTSRWVALAGCVLGFTMLIEVFIPHLSE